MEPWSRDLAGRLDELEIDSAVLRDNPLGDPHVRPVWVYVPPGYDDDTEHRYPVVYVLQGMTGQLDMWRNREPFRPTYPENVDRLFATGDVPPAIVVFVDCWTSFGGSQFLDSPGTGRYHSFLCDEVVPFVDARYRTDARREARALQGKSSGGYGALVTPILRPDLFSALACHCGDSLFEASYLPDFPKAVRALRDRYDGSYDDWWADARSRVFGTRKEDWDLLQPYGYAACYSADEDGTVRLPFDVATGRLIGDVWERWLAWDPVRMIPRSVDAMRSMRAIWLDAGNADEFFLDNGMVAVSKELDAIGVDHTLELFDGGHMSIGYRYPESLAFLARSLAS
jgi:S-formylglutathione hydrolase FrmB